MAKATRPLPSQEYLRECFDYDPETGELRWRERPLHHFETERYWQTWNKRFAGKLAGCSREDGRWLIRVDWNTYRRSRLVYKLARDAEPPNVDHINGDPSDDKIGNLRATTHAENQRNMRMRRDNRCGRKGVKAQPYGYCARIHVDGVTYYLGFFRTAEEAHAAYVEASSRLHGEFGRTV